MCAHHSNPKRESQIQVYISNISAHATIQVDFLILVSMDPQDLTVHFIQIFGTAVAPQTFVANKNWAHIAEP